MKDRAVPRVLTRISNAVVPGLLSDQSDDQLLGRIAEGDREAFRALWDRFGAAMYTVCRRRLSDQGAAEDATQEAFTSVWRRASTFDPRRGSATGWLFTVARNAAAQLARRDKGLDVTLTVLDGEEAAQDDAALSRLMVHAALAQLPARERAVLELAYFEDLSQSQIADRLSLPLGTVKTRIRSGLRRLSEYLGDIRE